MNLLFLIRQLFDHIAECLANFMSENDMFNEKLPLGFTFSFPLQQVGLTKGILKTWTKGFSCSGVVGQDVVQMLEDAIKRRGVSFYRLQKKRRLYVRLFFMYVAYWLLWQLWSDYEHLFFVWKGALVVVPLLPNQDIA